MLSSSGVTCVWLEVVDFGDGFVVEVEDVVEMGGGVVGFGVGFDEFFEEG